MTKNKRGYKIIKTSKMANTNSGSFSRKNTNFLSDPLNETIKEEIIKVIKIFTIKIM